jgi:TonB family protein
MNNFLFMKKLFLLLVLLLMVGKVTQATAQQISFVNTTQLLTDETEVPPLVPQNRLPQFPGGSEALTRFITETARYPLRAYREGREGTVYVEVYVLPTGKLQVLSVEGQLGGGCEQEAVRVVNEMPAWLPALRQSNPVKCRVKIPVSFRL